MTAIILSLVSAAGFGSAAIFARMGMQGVSPLASTIISVIFGFVPALILALVLAMDDITGLTAAAFGWFALLGAVNFLGGRNLSYQGIGRIGAARSGAILGTAAVFATVFAITLTGERPHPVILVGTVVVVLGLTAALGRSIRTGISDGNGAVFGYLFALAAAACYGATNVIGKELTEKYGSPLMITAFSLFFGALMLLPFAFNETVSAIKTMRRDPGFVVFAGLSGLAATTGVVCLYFALQRSEVAVISPIVSVNPLITLLLAQLFIARLEQLNRWLFLGTAIVVTGIVLVVLGSTL